MASVTPRFFEGDSLREIYPDICHTTLYHGSYSAPRGLKTVELLCPTIVLYNPADALPTGVGRYPKPEIGAVEAIQLCGGYTDVELTLAASRSFDKFREPEGHFHGAYGTRIGGQASKVARKLRNDPSSRQALVTLWDPQLDNKPGKRDYPCTVALQFLIRDDTLWCVTNMRSNDAWLGLAYDLFQFGQLQWTIANVLGIPAGPLVHRPTSLHAYETDWGKIDALTQGRPDEDDVHVEPLYGFRSPYSAWCIATDQPNVEVTGDPTESELWYTKIVGGLRERAAGASAG